MSHAQNCPWNYLPDRLGESCGLGNPKDSRFSANRAIFSEVCSAHVRAFLLYYDKFGRFLLDILCS